MCSLRWQTHLIQINAFFYKIWLITRKRVFHIFEILFWPAIGLVSVGLLTRFLELGSNMVAFILIGIIALSVLQVGQLDISYVLLYSVWNKSLKQELAAPITALHLVLGAWLMGIIHSLLVFSLLSGFIFVAPLLAFGMYSVSRQLCLGRRPTLAWTLRAAWRPLSNSLVFALVLASTAWAQRPRFT